MNTRLNCSEPRRNLSGELRHTRLHSAVSSLLFTGVLMGANGWLSANASAGIEACGAPPILTSGGETVLLWKDCPTGMWHLLATGGGVSKTRTFVGEVTGSKSADQVLPKYLEANDILDISDPSKIKFQMFSGGTVKDGFDFAFPAGAPVCLRLNEPIQTILVGPNRSPVTSPIDLRTMRPCGHPYFEDADIADNVDFPGDSNLGELPFPRISTGNLKLSGTAEQFSKYDIISVKPDRFAWLAQVQAINPDTKALRIHCPQEYQGWSATGACRTGAGIPFDGTGPATANCQVFAGHWLYAPGSSLISPISANSNTLIVADPSRYTVGRYVVIYDGGPGAFLNAEHAQVIAVNMATKALTLDARGYKSTARSHPAGAIVAEHVIGNDANQHPLNWAYNLSTASPLDASGRQLNLIMADWLAANYETDNRGEPSAVKLSGIMFDSDFHFVSDGGWGRLPDVNNDLVLDKGISQAGENLWGKGLDDFYTRVREQMPTAILVGGVRESRGYSSLNGTQLEGWPQRDLGLTATQSYQWLDGNLSAYSVQMHHGQVGPRYSEGINKMPTKLYPSVADPAVPDNSAFRFSFGLMLLDDGYYGQMNWHVSDPWWDEYAVNVERGTPKFGQALASNPLDETMIRTHRGWMGFPVGPRYRVYDPAEFAPDLSKVANGGFETDLTGWTGTNVTLSRTTGADNRLDGEAALMVSEHREYAIDDKGAIVGGPSIYLNKGQQYTVAFGVKSSAIRTIGVTLSTTQRFTVPAEWSRQVFTFTAETTGWFYLKFNVGREDNELLLDSVYVFEGNANVFRRDFDNAVIVVNGTPSARNVDLGETLQRIRGTGQDPINDGSAVTQVTIPPYDSAILIRP
jgi:hypothetical protein